MWDFQTNRRFSWATKYIIELLQGFYNRGEKPQQMWSIFAVRFGRDKFIVAIQFLVCNTDFFPGFGLIDAMGRLKPNIEVSLRQVLYRYLFLYRELTISNLRSAENEPILVINGTCESILFGFAEASFLMI